MPIELIETNETRPIDDVVDDAAHAAAAALEQAGFEVPLDSLYVLNDFLTQFVFGLPNYTDIAAKANEE